MNHPDPHTLPPLERLRRVRAGRPVTLDEARAALSRRWNARHGPPNAGGSDQRRPRL